METISIWQLSKALKWKYKTISIITCRPEFSGLVIELPTKRLVKIEDVPKFTEVLYRVLQSKTS